MAEIILTPEDYIKELDDQKKALANNLVEKGIEANENEKFNTLVPKVLAIPINVGLQIEVSTEEEMNALLETGEIGSVYKYIGTTGTYENGALYEITEESDPLQGTWVFNDTITVASSTSSTDINFVCNNIDMFYMRWDSIGIRFEGVEYVYTYDNGWNDVVYKTIEITSLFSEISGRMGAWTSPDAFLTWLQSNATKQSSRTFAKLIVPIGTLEITENGEYDVTNYANANVNVEDSPIPIEVSTEEEMNELLVNGELNGIYKYVGETRTYEKDTLYIRIEPILETSDGYYVVDSDGAIISLSVAEFVKLILQTDLEEITINENGEYSGEYSNITVDVPIPEGYIVPTGTIEITENGEYDVTTYANANVNVEDSPIPIEVSTEEEMNELLTTGEIGSVYKYIGTTGTYENGALYELTEEESDPLKGTWVFNDTISMPTVPYYVYVRYNTNGIERYGIGYNIAKGLMVYLTNVEESTMGGLTAYSGTWNKEAYKTIEITTLYDDLATHDNTTPADWLSWLQANATKQVSKQFTKLILQTDLEEITITENGEYSGEYSKVTVNVESGGSAEFNIAYGDTEPTDTSKLWVKASEPNEVQITTKPVYVADEFQEGIASLPTATYNIGVASVGTNIYLFGGNSDSGYLNTINVFDTETNTITTLDVTLPTGAYGIASAVVGTKVYLFGGNDSWYLSTINVFDTENNTISTLDVTLPKAGNNIASAVVGTKVYLFGGYGPRSTINVFDTENNTISTLDVTLPVELSYIASAVVGTKVYLFGGLKVGGSLSKINVFDTKNNTISTLDVTLPAAAYSIASASVGTNIYLFGGEGNSSELNTINVFDTENNTITTLSATLPTGTYGIASAVVGTKVYLFGGNDGSIRLDTINAFILGLSLPTNNMLLEATLIENTFNLLTNVEIGVKNVYIGNADGRGELLNAALYKNGAWTDI